MLKMIDLNLPYSVLIKLCINGKCSGARMIKGNRRKRKIRHPENTNENEANCFALAGVFIFFKDIISV